MPVSSNEREFALFILNRSGKQHLLQPIIDRCEKDNITVWTHFEQGLVQQYSHTPAEAQRKVQEWYEEFLAARESSKTVQAVIIPEPPVPTKVTPFEKPVKEQEIFVPAPAKKKSGAGLWVGILLALVVLVGGYYFLFVMKSNKKPSATTLYVLTEDGLVLRSNTNCDTAQNKKIYSIPYNQPVELLEKIDSNRNWIKVRVPGTKGPDNNPYEGYVAEYRMLGTKEVNASLDSIYRDRTWNPMAERLSYPLKKSLYQYISNTGFDWYVDPVTDNTSFQSIVDLSWKTFGKAVINNCAITTYTKYRVAILTNRTTRSKKAMIFSLSSNYNSEKIDELDLSSLSDPIIYKASGSSVYITDGRNKENKKFEISKNSSGAPVFKEYVAPNPLYDFFDQYVPPLDTIMDRLNL